MASAVNSQNSTFLAVKRFVVPRPAGFVVVGVLDFVCKALEVVALLLLVPLLDAFLHGTDGPGPSVLGQSISEEMGGLSSFFHGTSLLALSAAVFAVFLLKSSLVLVYQLYKARFRHGLVRDIRGEVFPAGIRAEPFFYDTHSGGGLANDIAIECERATQSLVVLVILLGLLAQVLMLFGFALGLSWELGLALAAMMSLALPLVRYLMALSKRYGEVLSKSSEHLSVIASRYLSGLRSIRMANRAGELATGFLDAASEYGRTRIVLDRLTALRGMAVEFFIVLSFFGVVAYADYFSELSTAEVIVFCVASLRMWQVLNQFLAKLQKFLAHVPSAVIVSNRLDYLNAHAETDLGSLIFEDGRKSIEFKDVWFEHDAFGDGESRGAALKGITFTIDPGEVTAIVGPSGSGKSTLLDLLPQLRRATGGKISVGDTSIEDYTLESLRSQIAYVPQNPQFLDGTVRDHISYGNRDLSGDAIKQAASRANMASVIEALPSGYETRLGEAGSQLSGGQRQRLDLARALGKQAPILIMDEPTSALDAESEAQFLRTITELRKNGDLTIIIVAHRLSTIAMADKIVVLDKGMVSETGSHDQLIARSGWYARAASGQVEGLALC